MMVAPITPYTPDLNGRDPVIAIRDTIERFGVLVSGWSADRFEQSYAPGKWSSRQVLIHLAQTEIALGARARLAVSTPSYRAHPFDQDVWMARESRVSGPEALDAFIAVARFNAAFFEQLSAADRATAFSHPEYGDLTVDWLIHQVAGHQIHHLRQLEQLAS